MPRALTADDRFAVLEVIQRYARACDSREFALFDETFTADAELDYRSSGGLRRRGRQWAVPRYFRAVLRRRLAAWAAAAGEGLGS